VLPCQFTDTLERPTLRGLGMMKRVGQGELGIELGEGDQVGTHSRRPRDVKLRPFDQSVHAGRAVHSAGRAV